MHHHAPLFRLLVFMLLIVGSAALVLFVATRQPFAELGPPIVEGERVMVDWQGQRMTLEALLSPAPPGEIRFPDQKQFRQWLRDRDGAAIVPEPLDFIEEPDTLGSYDAVNRFMARQGTISAMLSGGALAAAMGDDTGAIQVVDIGVAPSRPVSSLPVAFWIQFCAGVLTITVAAFFLALRRSSPPVLAFAAAGLGVTASAFSAAIYSTRHLALDAALFDVLSAGNQIFAYVFGVALIILFAIYPRPLIKLRRLWPLPALATLLLVLYRLQIATYELVALQFIVLVILVVIIALVAAQYRATRGDPAGRAVLLWLGLSVIIGAGVFALLVALPVALGFDVLINQSVSFIPLAAIYVGTALAVARFRLFDLGHWAFRVLLYSSTLALLFAFDAALVILLRLAPTTSLTIAVAVTGVAYLPLRDFLLQKLLQPGGMDLAALYRETVSVGLQTDATRPDAWAALLKQTFRPLHIQPAISTAAEPDPELRSEGEELVVPPLAGMPALSMRFAQEGRRLFSRKDASLVEDLVALVRSTIADRISYERGVEEERQRIARDLHDEVGATLLSGLHAQQPERRQECIVDALADVRQIASGLAGRDVTLSSLIAQLRHESRLRAEAQGYGLSWPLDGTVDDSDRILPYRLHRNFHAIHREALSNALSHGAGGEIAVTTRLQGGKLIHRMENPRHQNKEKSTAPTSVRNLGSTNMRRRAEQMDAVLTVEETDARFVLRLELGGLAT